MAAPIITYFTIPHYYGNHVRLLFLATTLFAFVGIPLWGHLVPFGKLFEVVAGITLIVLAGLINPHGRSVMLFSAVAAGLGVLFLELSAIAFHARDSFELLVAREVGAVMLAVALYFSVKTLRAMNQGKLGEWPVPWEFDKPGTTYE